MSKLLDLYKKKIHINLIKKFNYKSIMQVPRLLKIVINVGLNYKFLEKKKIDFILNNIKLISGQKPILTKSKKSISSFKIRKGFPIGCKVTLRKKIMWNFFDKLIFIVIPRIRDFRGFSIKNFDKYGNLNIGIKENTIFPEIDYEKINYLHGLNLSIITSKNNINECISLFKEFKFPFIN